MEIDFTPDNKIVLLSVARAKYNHPRCQHKRILVDEALAEVSCSDCGEKLNPVHVLARYAIEESWLFKNLEEFKKEREILSNKRRCKCRHCGQMTPIVRY